MFHIHRIVAVILLTCMCALWPMDVQARTTNAFSIGQILSADQLSKLPKTKLAVYEQTVGRIRQKAVLKYRTVDAYIHARGVKATAGKVFEAMTVNRFRAYAKNGEKMVTTASLGFPNDVADLYRISADGAVLDRYQLKAGFKGAVKAVADPKYVGIKIATHPEQLAKIENELRKMKLRGKPLNGPWLWVDDAIRSGRLTATIGDMPLSTRQSTMQGGKRYIERKFQEVAKILGPSPVLSFGVPITPPRPSSIVPVGRATLKSGALLTKIPFNLVAPIDVAYSGYRMYDTISRRYEFDDDIYAGKLVVQGGLAGTGIAGIGLGLIAVPEPITTVAGGAILITSVIFGVSDVGFDYAHSRRLDSRSRQLARLDVHSKHEVVDQLLRSMIDDPSE